MNITDYEHYRLIINGDHSSVTLPFSQQDYTRWLERILRLEDILLEVTQFDLDIDHPYQYLAGHLDALIAAKCVLSREGIVCGVSTTLKASRVNVNFLQNTRFFCD